MTTIIWAAILLGGEAGLLALALLLVSIFIDGAEGA